VELEGGESDLQKFKSGETGVSFAPTWLSWCFEWFNTNGTSIRSISVAAYVCISAFYRAMLRRAGYATVSSVRPSVCLSIRP